MFEMYIGRYIYAYILKTTGERSSFAASLQIPPSFSEGNDLLPRKLINGSQPYHFTLLFMNIY